MPVPPFLDSSSSFKESTNVEGEKKPSRFSPFRELEEEEEEEEEAEEEAEAEERDNNNREEKIGGSNGCMDDIPADLGFFNAPLSPTTAPTLPPPTSLLLHKPVTRARGPRAVGASAPPHPSPRAMEEGDEEGPLACLKTASSSSSPLPPRHHQKRQLFHPPPRLPSTLAAAAAEAGQTWDSANLADALAAFPALLKGLGFVQVDEGAALSEAVSGPQGSSALAAAALASLILVSRRGGVEEEVEEVECELRRQLGMGVSGEALGFDVD